MLQLFLPKHTSRSVARTLVDHLENEFPKMKVEIWKDYLKSLPNSLKETICESMAQDLGFELVYAHSNYRECREKLIWQKYRSG